MSESYVINVILSSQTITVHYKERGEPSEEFLILLAEPQVTAVFVQLYHRVRHMTMVLVHADLQGIIVLFADLSLV